MKYIKITDFVIGFIIVLSLLFLVNDDGNCKENGTINVSAGVSVSNSITDSKSRAWGVDQETPLTSGVWDFGYLNEGHKNGDKRDGIYADYEFNYHFSSQITTAFEVGPYFTATTITQPDGIHYRDSYCWSLLPAAKVKFKLNDNYAITGSWMHVLFAKDNKDSDVFLISIGYNP